ncbi:MAG: hypothetical protein J5I65_18285 [Aridibacter famidurans]|nr:hypothetical protein [Aridibacter famidurans]
MLRRTGSTALLCVLLLFIQSYVFPQDETPWLGTIGTREKRASVISIRTSASVTVSDGKKYVAESFYVDPQRGIFRIRYPDRTVTQGVEGKYFWTFDGKQEKEGGAPTETVVLGHQVHAQILFFERLHPGERETTTEAGLSSVTVRDTMAVWTFIYDQKSLNSMLIEIEGGPAVNFSFSDWREVDGIRLPFSVLIDDGIRKFDYRYTAIEFNKGTLADYRAPESDLTDEQNLLRLHRVVMDDHFFGDASGMKSINRAPFTVVSEGEVCTMTDAESDAGFDRIMGSRDYTVYDDLIRPVVKISKDGSLAWVVVKVYAKGVRFDSEGKPAGPLEFTSGWIELYEKTDGEWRMTGNVSNFAPDRK